MNFTFLLITFLNLFIHAFSKNYSELVNRDIRCKIDNTENTLDFFFKSNDQVVLKKKNEDNSEVIIQNYFYNLQKNILIIYNPLVLPMREETQINLETLKMKSGIFTNRYPMIRKGTCLYK